MGYSIECIYLDKSKPRLNISAKLGNLGEVWLRPEIPLKFYETIMEIADAAIKEREAHIKAEILGEKEATND